jgi:hypothetical protein
VGQPRPPESFPRVYSPPEPPSTARRSAFVGILTAVLAFGLASLAVVYLSSGFGRKPSQGRPFDAASRQPSSTQSPINSATPEQTPSASPTPTVGSPSPSGARPFVRLPPVCSTPSDATSTRLVPSPRITSRSSNTAVTTCTVVSTRGSRPSLHVEAYLFRPQNGGDPVKDAQAFVSSDWAQAHKDDGLTTTIVLERQPGLGDEAFHMYKIDKGEPVVVGEVEVRLRNAVVRVSYSRDSPAKADEQATQKRLLDEAAGVGRQTVRAFV